MVNTVLIKLDLNFDETNMSLLRLNGNISFLSAKNIAQVISSYETNRTLIDASGVDWIDYAGFDDLKKALTKKEVVVCTTSHQTMKIFFEFDPKVSVYLSWCQVLYNPTPD